MEQQDRLLSAARLWAIAQGMEDVTDRDNHNGCADLVFEKDDKLYVFLTQTERDTEQLRHCLAVVRELCDYVYIVTNDNILNEYIEHNGMNDVGILSYSNPTGFGFQYNCGNA